MHINLVETGCLVKLRAVRAQLEFGNTGQEPTASHERRQQKRSISMDLDAAVCCTLPPTKKYFTCVCSPIVSIAAMLNGVYVHGLPRPSLWCPCHCMQTPCLNAEDEVCKFSPRCGNGVLCLKKKKAAWKYSSEALGLVSCT